MEGAPWEEVVGYELEVSKGVNAAEAEIAACCLCHTSFYGFTREQRQNFFNKIGATTFGKLNVKNLVESYRSYLPSRKELLCNPVIHRAIRREMNLHRQYKPNREDKITKFLYQKRSWRTWKRYEINRMYKKRVNDISKFLNILPESLKRARLMFRVSYYFISSYRTYVNDVAQRFDYFNELIGKYGAFQNLSYSNCLVCVSCSKDFQTSSKEAELCALITKNLKGRVETVYRNDDSLGKDLQIDIINYE